MEQQLCTMCSNISIVLCKICNCAAYCSVECLEADMPIHQMLCGELRKNFSTPPNASARRGIFFPVAAKTPRFVWVTTQWRPPEDGDPGWEYVNREPYIGDGHSYTIRISGNCIRSRPRHDQITLFMRETCLVDGSKPNSSIAALTEGYKAFYPWRGGMLAMKLPTLRIDPGRYIHMDMVDFRDVVDLFHSYHSETNMSDERCNRHHKGPTSPLDEKLKVGSSKSKKLASGTTASSSSAGTKDMLNNLNLGADKAKTENSASGTASSSFTETKDMLNNLNLGEKDKDGETRPPVQELSGVRINCCGDRKGGRVQFEPIKVPISHPVWSAPIPSIPKLVGLPIRVRRIPSEVAPPAKSKRRKKPTFDENNQAATFLHMNANPNAKDWGWASPFEWQMPTGSVVVVQAERKEILPQHVEALCHLCQYVMQPLFEDSMGAGMDPENPIPKSDVLGRLTPREFELFYQGFRNWKRDNDPKYTEVNLPSWQLR